MKRLYSAICLWLEADAKAKGAEDEPQPAGDNFTNLEQGPLYSGDPELHRAHRGLSIYDDDGGAYRLRLGFNTDHMEAK